MELNRLDWKKRRSECLFNCALKKRLSRKVVYRVVERIKRSGWGRDPSLCPFMSAVFSLLLQFYLNEQVAERRILLASQHRIRLMRRKCPGSGRKNHDLLNWPESILEEKIGLYNMQKSLTGWKYHFTFYLPPRKEKNRQEGKGEAGSDSATEPTDWGRRSLRPSTWQLLKLWLEMEESMNFEKIESLIPIRKPNYQNDYRPTFMML